MCNRITAESDFLYEVVVYPDGEQFLTAPSWKSDDFETRKTMLCMACDDELQIDYGEPFATCKCGTQEWYL